MEKWYNWIPDTWMLMVALEQYPVAKLTRTYTYCIREILHRVDRNPVTAATPRICNLKAKQSQCHIGIFQASALTRGTRPPERLSQGGHCEFFRVCGPGPALHVGTV
jgi:hypothetical protein